MRIPDSLLEDIKEKISLQEVISEYVTLTQKGNRLWGLCPFHTEKTPSFSVDDQKGLFYCYGCKQGGSVFNFLMEMEQLTFIEAAQMLAEKANVELPNNQEHSQAYDKAADEQKLLAELYHRLRESFHHILLHHEQARTAREYLSSRGISADMISKFQLGYVPKQRNWLYHFLRKRHYSDEFLQKTGLFSQKYPQISMFSGRQIFPITDRRGRVVAFGGRALEDQSYAKYVNSPETAIFHKRKTLYGLHESKQGIRESGQLILAEGYFDVLALHQAGFAYAAAPLGTACTEEHGYEIKRHAKKVLLMFDQDSAGIDAMIKTLPILESLDIDTGIIALPKGKDPADLLGEDLALLKKSVKNPINSFEYLVKILTQRYDINLPEGKRSIFQQTYPLIASTASEIKRDEYLRTVADALQLDVHVIYDDYKSMERSASLREPRPVHDGEGGTPSEIQRDVELYIVLTLYAHEQLYSRFRNEIDPEMLRNPWAKQLISVLEDAFRRGITELDVLIEQIGDQHLKQFVIAELGSDTYHSNPERIVSDGLKRLKLRSLVEQQQAVVRKIRKLEKNSDAGSLQQLRDLLYEKKYLDEEIQIVRKPVL